MEVNKAKLPPNLLDEVMLPRCPPQFRKVAENIVLMLRVEVRWDYHNMTELDKILMLTYWNCFDRIHLVGQPGWWNFESWFIKEATSPELIRQARQWLVENQYLIVKAAVAEDAREAGEHWRQSVKH